jgi:hypothetical protein
MGVQFRRKAAWGRQLQGAVAWGQPAAEHGAAAEGKAARRKAASIASGGAVR